MEFLKGLVPRGDCGSERVKMGLTHLHKYKINTYLVFINAQSTAKVISGRRISTTSKLKKTYRAFQLAGENRYDDDDDDDDDKDPETKQPAVCY